MPAVRAEGDAVDQRMAAKRRRAYSSPCAAPSARDRPVDLAHLAGNAVEPRRDAVLDARVARSCMPTQMPKNGRAFRSSASLIASTMPSTASRLRRQSAKAPSPGRTMRSARATTSGSDGDDDPLAASGPRDDVLEGLGRRPDVAGAVVDERDGHVAPSGAGKRPMTSPASGDGGFGGGGSGGGGGVGAAVSGAQSRKKRSSASHSRRPSTTPTSR